MSLHVEDNGLP